MPATSLVLTVLGADRPGLVEAIARVVADHDANWLESRMARLAGKFAGILRVEVDEAKADALAAALRSLDDTGFEAIVSPDATPASADSSPLLLLELFGADHPGIVRAVSQVLAGQAVNVEELATETTIAANFGQPVFHAKAKLRLPAGADRAAAEGRLREALEAVAADLVVDITLAADAD
ncbi:MAG: ACT domain-containing protein [Planctomycetota bacterium]